MFGEVRSPVIESRIRSKFQELFHEYDQRINGLPRRSSSVVSTSETCLPQTQQQGSVMKKRGKPIDKYKQEMQGLVLEKSELDKYWAEDQEKDNVDVINWWKIHSARYPVLSSMARDIFAIPVATVASESTFSTGGRILDEFRSSLAPSMVEGLVALKIGFERRRRS